MEISIIQSQVEHLQSKGEFIKENYASPSVKFTLHKLQLDYYCIRYEQNVTMNPVSVHHLSDEEVKEWLLNDNAIPESKDLISNLTSPKS